MKFLFVFCLFFYVLWYIFFLPHRDFYNEKPQFVLQADSLILQFDQPEKYSKLYFNSVIQFKGVVTEIDLKNDTIKGALLNDKIYCFFENNVNMRVGQEIIIKGRFEAYDDLFKELQFTNCKLIDY